MTPSESSESSSPRRPQAGLAARLLRASPAELRDRVNIWTTIGYSLFVGDLQPYYYVLGYPKSGTNWVCKLLAGYLGIPVHEFWKYRWPRLSPAVMHMHRFLPFRGARRRTLYVLRDGRDIVVSDYHLRMRDCETNPALASELAGYLGAGHDPSDVAGNLPNFIRYLIDRRVSSTDYVTHVGIAFDHPYVRVRYEDLIADTASAFETAVGELLGEPVDAERLNRAVEAQRFENVTGRSAGTEDRSDFVRKGVAGEWRDQFSREAAEVYDAYAGDTLIRCGYEPDHDWVSRCHA